MYSIEGLVPKIGTKGQYELVDPFKCDDSLIYKCERVSSITDFKLTEKIDVLEELYKANGLEKSDYKHAVKTNIKIVTLKGVKDEIINVPDNYIKKIPDMAYVPYRQYIVSINLGLLPSNLNIENTLDGIETVISKTLNVKSNALVHNYKSNRFVDWKTHVEMEEARESGIKPYTTLWERISVLEKENNALSDAIKELEEIIESMG